MIKYFFPRVRIISRGELDLNMVEFIEHEYFFESF